MRVRYWCAEGRKSAKNPEIVQVEEVECEGIRCASISGARVPRLNRSTTPPIPESKRTSKGRAGQNNVPVARNQVHLLPLEWYNEERVMEGADRGEFLKFLLGVRRW